MYMVSIFVIISGAANLWKREIFISHYGIICQLIKEPWRRVIKTNLPCDTYKFAKYFEFCVIIPLIAIDQITFHLHILRQLLPVLSMWLIAFDFQIKFLQNISNTKILSKKYRKICKISHYFNNYYGYTFLFKIIFVVLYYSVNLGQVFLPDELYGRKIYYLEHFGSFVLIFGICAHFAHLVVPFVATIII